VSQLWFLFCFACSLGSPTLSSLHHLITCYISSWSQDPDVCLYSGSCITRLQVDFPCPQRPIRSSFIDFVRRSWSVSTAWCLSTSGGSFNDPIIGHNLHRDIILLQSNKIQQSRIFLIAKLEPLILQHECVGDPVTVLLSLHCRSFQERYHKHILINYEGWRQK
jgi:hypothetical protein